MYRSTPLLRGTLDVMVLAALSWGPMHGYGITSWLEQQSAGVLDVEDSAMYQALHRMEERGLLSGDWGITERNRQARYYSITVAGREWLEAQIDEWRRYSVAVTGILSLAELG